MPMARVWNGLELQERVNRAAGRAIVAIGTDVAVNTKRVTHRITGTLARSVHVAPPGQEHDDEQELRQAQTTDLMLSSFGATSFATRIGTALGPAVEVGSWLPYACVEWVGRQHPGVQQGLEMSRGARADLIVMTAFREEGLA